MILVNAKKKKALTLKKKAQKALQPIKKKQATEKSTKKQYGAFKSTHYDPCVLERGYFCNLRLEWTR